MDYQLTLHAEDALEKRRIPREWMERVLSSPESSEPDSIDPELEHRLAPIEEFEGRILRVIVNTAAVPPRVITVYFDRRRKRP
ncbi:MAG TPA: DUF4258 domain-containing protein [bacterium]|nr:DUF4258 domain-containing protein [bacterium]